MPSVDPGAARASELTLPPAVAESHDEQPAPLSESPSSADSSAARAINSTVPTATADLTLQDAQVACATADTARAQSLDNVRRDSPDSTSASVPESCDIWASFNLSAAMSEMSDLDVSGFRANVVSLVTLQALDIKHAPSKGEVDVRARNFLKSLKEAWPAAHAYFSRNYFNDAVKSLVCDAWRFLFLSSNATAAEESIQRTIRYACFNGVRTKDPSAPLFRIIGDPGNPDVTARSLTTMLYNRNIVHRQQRGKTDASLRNLRVLQKAAVIYVSAVLGINETVIKSVAGKPYEQRLVVKYSGSKLLYERRQRSATPAASSVDQVAFAADLLHLPQEETDSCEYNSASVNKLLRLRHEREASKMLRCVQRTEFHVDVARRSCTCERHTSRCPELLAGEIYARDNLGWASCICDEDSATLDIVRSYASRLIAFCKQKACPSPYRAISVLPTRKRPRSPPSESTHESSVLVNALVGRLERAVSTARIAASSGVPIDAALLRLIKRAADILDGVEFTPGMPSVSRALMAPAMVEDVVSAAVAASTDRKRRRSQGDVTCKVIQKYQSRAMGKTSGTPVYPPRCLWQTVRVGRKGRRRGLSIVPFRGRRKATEILYKLETHETAGAPEGSRVVAIDFETTGFGKTCRVVEFGAVDNASTDAPFRRRVNPGGVRIEPQATAVHGIRDGDVARMPSFACIWDLFCRKYLATSTTVVLLSYNGFKFDFPVLFAELSRAKLPIPPSLRFADMLVHVQRRCFGDLQSAKLTDVYRAVTGNMLAHAHSAAADAAATLALYNKALAPSHVPATAQASAAHVPPFSLVLRRAVSTTSCRYASMLYSQ